MKKAIKMVKEISIYAIVVIVILSMAFLLASCTQNQRARNWGGTETIQLEKNQKLVNITWKEQSHLWILTRPMKDYELPETYEFVEKSSWGVMQGKVIVVENK